MSTYLQLVQDLHREVGAAGVAPTAIAGQTGENQRLVKWVQEADNYVQTLWHNWKFLIDMSFSMSTVASTRDMSAPVTVNMWDWKTFKIDGDPIELVEYYKIRHETFDITIEDQPSRVIILPDNNLRFDPVPDAAYTITADYFVKPTLLAVDADISAIPEEFHSSVILGRAMVLYGNFENAAEIKDQGLELYSEFLGRLESLQLPNQHNARFNSEAAPIEVIAQ
jgi:hypothetical protein